MVSYDTGVEAHTFFYIFLSDLVLLAQISLFLTISHVKPKLSVPVHVPWGMYPSKQHVADFDLWHTLPFLAMKKICVVKTDVFSISNTGFAYILFIALFKELCSILLNVGKVGGLIPWDFAT